MPTLRVGVITHPAPDLTAPYFSACLAGLSDLFGKPSLFINPRQPMDGWILLAPSPAQIDAARAAGIPAVVVNGFSQDLPSIDLDNVGAARAVTSHLAGLGHRRIGFIGGKAETSNARDRQEGYRRSLEEQGIAWDACLVIEGRFAREGGKRAMNELLASPSPPTAVFAANDHMALGAWEILKGKNIPVPGDVALAGFDDIPEAESMGLTSVRQPLAAMARQAGVWLLDWVQAGGRPAVGQALVPGELAVRISSGSKRPV